MLLVWALCAGCRRFDVCGDAGDCPAVEEGVKGSIGTGGTSGSGGTRSEGGCTDGYEDCDHTTLNGCETDTSSAFAHCGACGQSCDGACSAGSCVSFAALVADRYGSSVTMGPTIVTTATHAYYVADESLATGLGIERVSLRDGSVEPLVEIGTWNTVDALALGASRLYVAADDRLFSVPHAGGELRAEEADGAQWVAAAGSTVAVVRDQRLFVRAGDRGPFVEVPEIATVSAIAGESAIGVETLAIAESFWEGDELRYRLWFRGEGGGLDLRASGSGEVVSMTLFRGRVYFEVEHGDRNDAYFVLDEDDAEPIEVPSMTGVTAWTPVKISWWYDEASIVAAFGSPRSGLRFISLASTPFTAEWPTEGAISGLATVESELLFFDGARRALTRVNLEELIAPRLLSTP
nr:MAG: hypothetical protein DIU78_02310 [Pseudomonadota bacterium]